MKKLELSRIHGVNWVWVDANTNFFSVFAYTSN